MEVRKNNIKGKWFRPVSALNSDEPVGIVYIVWSILSCSMKKYEPPGGIFAWFHKIIFLTVNLFILKTCLFSCPIILLELRKQVYFLLLMQPFTITYSQAIKQELLKLDCCLLATALSRACSFSSTTKRFFLDYFVANNFVP